jgi:hypothetical protein
MVIYCVLFGVRAEFLNILLISVGFKGLNAFKNLSGELHALETSYFHFFMSVT